MGLLVPQLCLLFGSSESARQASRRRIGAGHIFLCVTLVYFYYPRLLPFLYLALLASSLQRFV